MKSSDPEKKQASSAKIPLGSGTRYDQTISNNLYEKVQMFSFKALKTRTTLFRPKGRRLTGKGGE